MTGQYGNEQISAVAVLNADSLNAELSSGFRQAASRHSSWPMNATQKHAVKLSARHTIRKLYYAILYNIIYMNYMNYK